MLEERLHYVQYSTVSKPFQRPLRAGDLAGRILEAPLRASRAQVQLGHANDGHEASEV